MNAQVKAQTPVRVLEDVVFEQFNEANVSLLSKEIEKQLSAIGAKFGITLNTSVGKMTSNSLSIRVNGYIASDLEGGVKPQWKANYMRLCHLIGLTPDDFGRHVHNLNLKHPEKEQYEIVGLTPKSLDLIIRTASDKFYRLPLEESKFVDGTEAQPIKAVIAEPVVAEPVEVVNEVPVDEVESNDSVVQDVIEEVLKPSSLIDYDYEPVTDSLDTLDHDFDVDAPELD